MLELFRVFNLKYKTEIPEGFYEDPEIKKLISFYYITEHMLSVGRSKFNALLNYTPVDYDKKAMEESQKLGFLCKMRDAIVFSLNKIGIYDL